MSWLFGGGNSDPKAATFHPVSSRYQGSELVGELGPQDLEWVCPGGFATESHVFYNILEDGKFLILQVIHSSIGVWFPTIQFVFKIYDPATKEVVWRSTNVNNFKCPIPGLDKRSCKSDQFTVAYKTKPDAEYPEAYTITSNATDDVQVLVEISRLGSAPGWKIGKDPQAGKSFYGTDTEKPEGYVYHRFWPRTQISGQIIYKGKAIAANGPGMHVHAIMGLRPNLVAARWNFANFQSNDHGGVSAIQMELTTLEQFGRHGPGSGGVKVNIGSLVVGGKLVCVTAETTWPDEKQDPKASLISRAFHHNAEHDSDTSYPQPKSIEFVWGGPSILSGAEGAISANLTVDVGSPKAPKGLIEKVDLLAEIPAVVKAVISYVAGTKPYIYQWLNPTTLTITAPESVIPGGPEGVKIEGTLFNEATFVS